MLPYTLPEMHRVVGVVPKPKFKSAGEQDSNGAGLPLWTVSVKITWTDEEGDPNSETIRVSVPSPSEPPGLIGQSITAEGLQMGAVGDNIYFRAGKVIPKQTAK